VTLNREDSFALNDAASHGIMHYQNMADGTDDDGSRLRCKGRIEAIIRAAKKLQSRELQREYENGLAERDGLTFTVMLNRDDSFHLYDARRTAEQRLLMASFRARKLFVNACSKISPSASRRTP
jgi:hypothetical protein